MTTEKKPAEKPAPTKSQEVAADIAALLRARNPLLWIVSREEARVESYLMEAAAAAGYLARTWDIAQGVSNMDGKLQDGLGGRDKIGDTAPDAMLEAIREASTNEDKPMRGVWIMRDLPPWLEGPSGAIVVRSLRNLSRSLSGAPRENAQAIIVLSPHGDIPAELAGHATVIEWPLPDRSEIAATLDAAIEALPEFETDPVTKEPDPTRPLRSKAAPNGIREAAIDAAVGLSGGEAQACYARSLVQLRRIDPTTVAKEKKRVIARERVLEWYDQIPDGLDAVGGLDNLKSWLALRSSAYTPAARKFGIRAPKGIFLVGVPGCGKTLTAKAVSTAWGVPLVRFNFGAMKSKFVGESEGTIRRAYRTIEALGRCTVWIDEIEKDLQGATSGSADGGVSADALGSFLSWMQERQGEAFVIATANDVESLPPELLRKGRFDEIFFVDLPNFEERGAILQAALRAHGRKPDVLSSHEMLDIASACDGFTGAEIAAIVPDALFAAFNEKGREIEAKDLLTAAKTVVPLSKSNASKIERLRQWGKERARPATTPKTETAQKKKTTSPALDL